MDWDDVKYFLELARSRTLTMTARRLGVKHTTVARRLARLELACGVPLFSRTPSGYALNRHGEALLERAEAMEIAFRRIESVLPADADRVSGVVRVGCTEGYGGFIIGPHLEKLSRLHPELQVELIVQPRAIQLPRNEADIVITIDRPERGPYLISKLFDYRLQLFAAPDYLARHPPIRSPEDLEAHRFISYVAELEPAKDLPGITHLRHAARAQIRSTSLFAQKAAAMAGAGLVIIPRYCVGAQDALVPVLPETVQFERTYWMLMPIDLRQVTRANAVWQELLASARESAARLTQGMG